MLRKNALLLLFVLGLFLQGCVKPQPVSTHGPIFFPPPPDAPRIQYLTGFNDSTAIEVQDTSLKLVVTGTDKRTYIKKIGKPSGLFARKGKLYVTSTSLGEVVTIDFANKKMEFLKGNIGPGKLIKPVSVAVDDNDVMYVADTGRDAIFVFNAAGDFVKKLQAPAENSRLVAVATHGNYVYALDIKNSKIWVYDPKIAAPVRSFGSESENVADNLAIPYGMTIDQAGFIYVTNLGTSRVLKFDIDGNHLGGFGRMGKSSGEFARPRGIAVDDAKNIFVVDGGHQVVQVFNEEFRLLGFFGNPGLPAGSLNIPSGIAISSDNVDYFKKFAAPGFKLERIIFVANQSTTAINPSVSVYGMGEMK